MIGFSVMFLNNPAEFLNVQYQSLLQYSEADYH